MHTEAGSAGLLLLATLAALAWVNGPFGSTYAEVWGTDLSVRLGDRELTEDLRDWVNDGLMVFFFFVVGLEIRRELAMGELTDRRRLRIPAIAALTGIGGPGARGHRPARARGCGLRGGQRRHRHPDVLRRRAPPLRRVRRRHPRGAPAGGGPHRALMPGRGAGPHAAVRSSRTSGSWTPARPCRRTVARSS